jgi:hypothetical protein
MIRPLLIALAFAATVGGNVNIGSANAVVAFGQQNSALGAYSAIPGGLQASDHTFVGKNCYASGNLAGGLVRGDAQTCYAVLRGTGATGAGIRLTSDNTAPSAVNCLNVPAFTGYAISNLTVMAFDRTIPANSEAWLGWTGLITRPDATSVSVVQMNATPTPKTTGTVTGSAISATADVTFACLNLAFTPPTGNTDTWDVAARVETVEVQ